MGVWDVVQETVGGAVDTAGNYISPPPPPPPVPP